MTARAWLAALKRRADRRSIPAIGSGGGRRAGSSSSSVRRHMALAGDIYLHLHVAFMNAQRAASWRVAVKTGKTMLWAADAGSVTLSCGGRRAGGSGRVLVCGGKTGEVAVDVRGRKYQ